MLNKFIVNNFKSLVNVTYKPGTVNLLVGVNNSGKTNLCQALRFFSQTAQKRAASLMQSWYDAEGPSWVKNVYFDHPTIDLDCVCDLVVDDETLMFHYFLALRSLPIGIGVSDVVVERLQVSGGSFGRSGMTLLENEAGEIRLLNEQRYLKGEPPDACYYGTTANTNVTMLSRLHDSQANQRAIAFQNYLADWQYYDLNPHRLRDDRFDPQADALSFDGANLASTLFNLKNRDERHYRRLIELVQKVERRLDALNFTIAGERIQMELTDAQDHRFGPASVSNGTLCFMALCYIILNNARQSSPPLTIVEEPENSLYVRYLKPLFESIDPTGAGGQYIFTSHSPYFIDLFDIHLENITLMEDRGTYSTLVEPDPAQVRKYLEEMPLGELHFREMLV
ncbi:MAG: AAA family ATPase [Chloroflexota bacterium]|nr:AAA family ATPase [Chloroflexota bacterium]